MNLATVKKKLSECHVVAGVTLDLFKDVNSNYLIERTLEELKKIKYYHKIGQLTDMDDCAVSVIQLMAMFRVKLIEEQNGTIQDGQKK